MKKFFLTFALAVVSALVLACSPVYAQQSEKQVYCGNLAHIGYLAATYTHQGVSEKQLTDDMEFNLAKSKLKDDVKAAIRSALSFAVVMAQDNFSPETIAKYQYYGCIMSTQVLEHSDNTI